MPTRRFASHSVVLAAALATTACAPAAAPVATDDPPVAQAPPVAARSLHAFDLGGRRIVVPVESAFLPASERLPGAMAVTQSAMHPGLRLLQLFHTEANYARLATGGVAEGHWVAVTIGRGMEARDVTLAEFATRLRDAGEAMAENARRQASAAQDAARAARMSETAGAPLGMAVDVADAPSVYRHDARTFRTRSRGRVTIRSGTDADAAGIPVELGVLAADVLVAGRSLGFEWHVTPYSPEAMALAQRRFDAMIDAVVDANPAEAPRGD